ncbi:MAG: M50 family metallopeptidase [Candidatus Micrarchaeaceae archaeon]
MKEYKSIVAAVVLIAVSLIALYLLFTAKSANIVVRVVLALALLVAVGSMMRKAFKLNGGYGLYMAGSKKGLATIDHISKKYGTFWDFMAMWGLTLGFGLLTYPLLKGKIDKRVYAFGIVSLLVILFLVLPYISYGFQFINISQIQTAISSSQASGHSSPSIATYAIYAVTVLAGFSGLILSSLFINTESILYSFILFATNPSLGAAGSGISSQIPGVAPIIPGIDIPLIAGIISLAVLLMIHEFSHGVLARRAKVKLKEIGVLMFGFIPIGGYVEPDEKMVNRLDSTKQTKIFSAGISANFIAMLVFFALMMAVLYYVAPGAYHYGVVITGTIPGYPASGVLSKGMQVLKWNNYTVSGISNLTAASASDRPNSTITVLTSTGTYMIRAVADPSNSSKGLIGVSLGSEPILNTPYAKAVYFAYTVFALSMLLNFLVAVVNLLPIPGLDGWRIYMVNIKSERFTKTLGAFIIILLIINVLPWIFYL